MVELKETPGKAGETPEKRGEPYLGGAGGKTGALIRNTMEIRRASKKAGVHRKKQKLLNDTRERRSSSRKAGGIEENTKKRWSNTRKRGEPRTQGIRKIPYLFGVTGGKTGVEVETLRKRGELQKSLVYTRKRWRSTRKK